MLMYEMNEYECTSRTNGRVYEYNIVKVSIRQVVK